MRFQLHSYQNLRKQNYLHYLPPSRQHKTKHLGLLSLQTFSTVHQMQSVVGVSLYMKVYCSIKWLHQASSLTCLNFSISTPYIGMARKKMAAPLYVYKVTCSKLCPKLSHKLLWTKPVILQCFNSNKTVTLSESIAEVPNREVAKLSNCHNSSFQFFLPRP